MDSDKCINQCVNQGNDDNGSAAADTQPTGGAACGETESQSVTKRPLKLTQKALFDKLETLQKTRKSKLTKASNLKESIQELMQDREYETEVHCAFDKYQTLCDEAKETHASLLHLLPPAEKEKHDIWFKAKLLSVNEFIDRVKCWLSNPEVKKPAEKDDDDCDEGEVKPCDSISNVETNVSSKKSYQKSHTSSRSGRSSTASARIQAEAERAALEARAAALKEKHALEEQTEQLRRRKERLELDTEMAASAAKLAVLSASSHQAHSTTHSNGMESYFEKAAKLKDASTILNPHEKGARLKDTSTIFNPHEKGARLKETSTMLNPQAKEYEPALVDSQQPPPVQQQNQPAYRNANQNTQEDQSNKIWKEHGKTSSEPLLDSHVQQTNPKPIQSHLPLPKMDDTSALCNLLQKQNEISALLIQKQTAH